MSKCLVTKTSQSLRLTSDYGSRRVQSWVGLCYEKWTHVHVWYGNGALRSCRLRRRCKRMMAIVATRRKPVHRQTFITGTGKEDVSADMICGYPSCLRALTVNLLTAQAVSMITRDIRHFFFLRVRKQSP